MNSSLKILEVSELNRLKWMEKFSGLTFEQYNFKPEPDKWSLSQTADHLILSEGGTLRYMRNKMKGKNKLKRTGLFSWIKFNALILAFKLPLKYKVPTKGIESNDQKKFTDSEEKWASIRKELIEFFNQLEDEYWEKELFRHPIAGIFNGEQTVDFLTNHLIHHEKQFNRILNHPNFPT